MCCHAESGKPSSPEHTAGKWGDLNCDLPPQTMDHLLNFIKNDIQPDFALWAGDSVSHDFADIGEKETEQNLIRATQHVHKVLGDIPWYLAAGNHDAYPMDFLHGDTDTPNKVQNAWQNSTSSFQSYMQSETWKIRILLNRSEHHWTKERQTDIDQHKLLLLCKLGNS